MTARLCIVPPAGEPIIEWRDETARLRARIREVEAERDAERDRASKLAAKLAVTENKLLVAEMHRDLLAAARRGEPAPGLEVCS